MCRFKPSGEETLSTFPVNYDWHTFRKGYRNTFTEEGFDNHMIWSSQLMFNCPVPPGLRERIKDGSTVVDDYATLFLDIVPIRTPPRYGPPKEFLPPRFDVPNTINATAEYGTDHVLPLTDDAGRWENVPICKPSLMTYGITDDQKRKDEQSNDTVGTHHVVPTGFVPPPKVHKLVACTWTSNTFKTRGGRSTVSDGEQRLKEWLAFHLLAGFDHMYIYDNSGAFSSDADLSAVTNLFPGRVTRINWPSRVCNNNKGNSDNKGERSSQYAAETSCRLRFGTHSTWLGSMDTDEYLVPQGKYTDLRVLLDHLDREEKLKILSFHSLRSSLRFDKLAPFEVANNGFHPELPAGTPFLEAYNCDRELPPKTKFIPAEKQIYQPDYVKLHFVHYSTITALSQLSQARLKELGGYRWTQRYKEPHGRFAAETNDALMLHTKSVAGPDANHFDKECRKPRQGPMDGACKFGFPWPNRAEDPSRPLTEEGYARNCFTHENVETYWVPRLKAALEAL